MKKLFAFAVAAIVLAVFVVAVSALLRRGGGVRPSTLAGEETAAEEGTRAAFGSGATAPVLVELFTSEGCSSCPPADALLARLVKTQPIEGAEIIPLALHVDYWNYLGWRDPFSSADFSARQSEYAAAYRKDGVYTPQMIVDGVTEFPGGNNGAANDAIAKAARNPKADVKITRAAGGEETSVRLNLRLENIPRVKEGDAAYVLLAVTESDLTTDVQRGENSGRKLSHVGVVRQLKTIGSLADARNGVFTAEAVVPVEKNWRRDKLRAVIFAQERGSRRILAVGALKLFG